MDNEIKIISHLESLIEITNNIYDYILIEDLVSEILLLENLDIANYKIKKIILKYLTSKVIIPFQKSYKSKVIGIYNKRAYIGIIWRDNLKNKVIESKKKNKNYHLYRHYNLIELLSDISKQEDFIKIIDNKISKNEINWPPINVIYYQRILFEKFKNMDNIRMTTVLNTEDIEFINYISKSLVYSKNINDTLNIESFILKYKSTLKNIELCIYNKMLSLYIYMYICNNDIDMYNKLCKDNNNYSYIKTIK